MAWGEVQLTHGCRFQFRSDLQGHLKLVIFQIKPPDLALFLLFCELRSAVRLSHPAMTSFYSEYKLLPLFYLKAEVKVKVQGPLQRSRAP